MMDQCKALDKEATAKMSPAALKVLQGKRMGLWKALANRFERPHTNIIDEILEGIRLVGNGPASEFFPKGIQLATSSPEALRKQSKWLRHYVVGKCSQSSDLDADDECWMQTLEEQQKGWLEGPFDSEAQVSDLLGLQ